MVREVLQLEPGANASSISKGFFLNRKTLAGLVLAIIAGLVATGLLVYYYTGCIPPNTLGSHSKHIEDLSYGLVNNRLRDVRLPKSVLPDHYEIHLMPFLPPDNFSFSGRVTIRINVTEPTKFITLHAKELTVNNEEVWVRNAINTINITVKEISNETDKDFLILHLDESLHRGEQYYVSLEFTGVLNDILVGFYRSSYTDGNETRWLATTQFEPTDARRAFPCFDEPTMKAKFKLFIGHHKNYTSISNMPAKEVGKPLKEDANYVWDEYEESVPMSTYLVAFVVSDFVSVKDGIFAVWTRKSAIHQANYSLHIGPRILQNYDTFFGLPFPLPKMDMIAIPDFSAGAMENWGLITFRETAMLYEEGVSTRLNKQRVGVVVAHELAHQWFGNLVTPSWWSDLWLNEGFASYVEYLGVDGVEPTWKMLEQFVVLDINDAFDLDALQSSHPISVKVNHPDEIDELFDKVSYSKGSSIIRMMDHFLRRSVLKNGLTRYLKDKAYKNAQQDDLWNALTIQAHEDQSLPMSVSVKQIMDTWTLQTGYPIVYVTRNYSSGTAQITQRRFLLIPTDEKSSKTKSSLWWIPLSFTSGDNPDFESTYPSQWMKAEPEITLDLGIPDNVWVLFNVQLTGFYRVNYDERNWKLLAEQMSSSRENLQVLSSISRAQIVSDSLNLARAGHLDYKIALNLTRFLRFEDEFVPWQAAYNAFTYLETMFMPSGNFEFYKNHILHLINNTYNQIGFRENSSDQHLNVLLRELILRWSCHLRHKECVRNALAAFTNWKTIKDPDNENPISPDLKRLVYCTAARVGSVSDWDFMWQRYLNANLGSERENIMSGLVCSNEVWILNRLLDRAMTKNSGIRKQDVQKIFTNTAKASSTGQIVTFRKMRENWPWLLKNFGSGSFTLGKLVTEVTKRFNTAFDLNELTNWAHTNKESLGTAGQSVKQAIEYVAANVKWMDSNFDHVTKWLQEAQNYV